MGTSLLREQGIRPHALAEQIISFGESHARAAPSLRSTPNMIYDTDVAVAQANYHYRNLRAEPSVRSTSSFKSLQSKLPWQYQDKGRNPFAYQDNIKVAHQRPIVYQQQDPVHITSTRY
jgi:hypothetical protein